MITIADLRKLPPSPQVFALMRREWPAEQRRRRQHRAMTKDESTVTRWEAQWLLEQIPQDPPHVIAARRRELLDAVDTLRGDR